MSTWKFGDSWITFHQKHTGIGSAKLHSQQEAYERNQQRCSDTGGAEDRDTSGGSRNRALVGEGVCGELR